MCRKKLHNLKENKMKSNNNNQVTGSTTYSDGRDGESHTKNISSYQQAEEKATQSFNKLMNTADRFDAKLDDLMTKLKLTKVELSPNKLMDIVAFFTLGGVIVIGLLMFLTRLLQVMYGA